MSGYAYRDPERLDGKPWRGTMIPRPALVEVDRMDGATLMAWTSYLYKNARANVDYDFEMARQERGWRKVGGWR